MPAFPASLALLVLAPERAPSMGAQTTLIADAQALAFDEAAPETPPVPPDASPDDPEGGAASAEIVVTARDRASPTDPLVSINGATFDALQVADRLFVAPVAHGYKAAVPHVVRDGVSNALNNLDEPIVFVNFILQGKPRLALRTVLRFAINSTIGAAGLIDIAKRKPFHLARRSNGLADTLGYYGVKPGAFLFLPIIGATTLRDVAGRVFDLSLLPTTFGGIFKQPAFTLSKGALSAVDERVHADDQGRIERHAATDPYVAVRNHYLQTRAEEIRVLRAEPGLRHRRPAVAAQPD